MRVTTYIFKGNEKTISHDYNYHQILLLLEALIVSAFIIIYALVSVSSDDMVKEVAKACLLVVKYQHYMYLWFFIKEKLRCFLL